MTEKRYYQRDYEELYYIIDSQVISEKDFDERVEYDGYNAFEDSLTGEEIVGLLNENEQLKQQLRIFEDGLKSEIKQTKITMEDWHECLTDCRKLKEENEQLKQQLQVCLKHHNCILETEKICVMCDECASLSMDYTNSIGGIL